VRIGVPSLTHGKENRGTFSEQRTANREQCLA
jgi:hypothetical protein